VSASDYRLIPARDAGKLLRPDAPLTAVGARQALRRAGIRELRGYRESDVVWLANRRNNRRQSVVENIKLGSYKIRLNVAGNGIVGDISVSGFRSLEAATEVGELFAEALCKTYSATVKVEYLRHE
jgi:hypothetical protein